MTEKKQSSLTDKYDLPEVDVVKGRHISLVWIIPLVAVGIGAWLVLQVFVQRGIPVTLTFKDGSSVDVKTPVKYEGVTVGLVKAVDLRKDLDGVVVEITLQRSAAGLAREGAPVLVRVVEKIAARFGIVVQEKVALGAVPVLSALSGSMINALFMEHFQNKARGHFIVRRLEAAHDPALVREAYEALA